MSVIHPCPNDSGAQVIIKNPCSPTPLAAWQHPDSVAIVVPGGPMPADLNGIPFIDWADLPDCPAGWRAVEGQTEIAEPAFVPSPHKFPAAGVVIEEPDGRVWLVSPSNGFGGYIHTFPKGRLEHGIGQQASAIKEALEEAGLKVVITGFLLDAERSTTRTRYYCARRTGGNPASMGWESQAVLLVPRAKLADFLTHPNDVPLLKALQENL
ncbi:MAG: NUDIX hydrolase [Burkholderiaceae bacterium]|nr:NUDIX hydrolase [Burkholderiaceae bacterium]